MPTMALPRPPDGLGIVSSSNPVSMTHPAGILEAGGDFVWADDPDQRFHVQALEKQDSEPPLIVIWLSGSGGHNELAVSQGARGTTAYAIWQSAILVSPRSVRKYKADVPEWIIMLTAAVSQVGGQVVLAGFSRGAKWCHEILRRIFHNGSRVEWLLGTDEPIEV